MIACNNLYLSYGRGQEILKGASLKAPNGQITCLLGKNGCGKSTLLSCIMKQNRCQGQILLDGEDIGPLREMQLARGVSCLPQRLPSPQITVRELAALGRFPYAGALGILSPNDRDAVEHALKMTGLTALADRLVSTLSGGERQRAFFAMLLAQDAPNVLLDEPTTYMDAQGVAEFIQFLQLLRTQRRAILLVMHDIALALETADRFCFLQDGQIACAESADECLKRRLVESCFALSPYPVDLPGPDGGAVRRYVLSPWKNA